jgi:NTE family protein
MGAETVVAVDLNATLLGRRRRPGPAEVPDGSAPAERGIRATLQVLASDLRARLSRDSGPIGEEPPGIVDVVLRSIAIMQARITRSRIAGDPPDLLVTPRLPDFALLDFDRAAEAIDEGRQAVGRALAAAARDEVRPAPL